MRLNILPTGISFRFSGEIKSFTDKQKLREFSTTKPTLQILKELLKTGNTKERKDSQKQTQNNKVNSSRLIYINNYLKFKWMKWSNQKTQTGWMYMKTRPIYIYLVYKRPIPDLETLTDWKWETRRRYSMQMDIKRKQE